VLVGSGHERQTPRRTGRRRTGPSLRRSARRVAAPGDVAGHRSPCCGPAEPGLVDAQHRGRRRLAQYCRAEAGERSLHRRPGHPMEAGYLGHRSVLTHRLGHRGAQPHRGTGTRRHGRHLIGERPDRTVGAPAAPPTLVPQDLHRGRPVRQILRRGDRVVLDRCRLLTAGRRQPGPPLVRVHMHHSGAILVQLDTLHDQTWQPEQQRRSVLQDPWPPPAAVRTQRESGGHGSTQRRRAEDLARSRL
jgi:hypothetical protein